MAGKDTSSEAAAVLGVLHTKLEQWQQFSATATVTFTQSFAATRLHFYESAVVRLTDSLVRCEQTRSSLSVASESTLLLLHETDTALVSAQRKISELYLLVSERQEAALCSEFQKVYESALAQERRKQELRADAHTLKQRLSQLQADSSAAAQSANQSLRDIEAMDAEVQTLRARQACESAELDTLRSTVDAEDASTQKLGAALHHIEKINACVEEKCGELQRDILALSSKLSKRYPAALSASAKKSRLQAHNG